MTEVADWYAELERERRTKLQRLRWLERNPAPERLDLPPAALVEYQLHPHVLQQQRLLYAIASGHGDPPLGACDHLGRLPDDRR